MPSVKDLEKQIKSLQKSVEVLTAAVQSLTVVDLYVSSAYRSLCSLSLTP